VASAEPFFEQFVGEQFESAAYYQVRSATGACRSWRYDWISMLVLGKHGVKL
jgi:hypothetical protein